MWAAFMAMMSLILWSGSESAILKREVNLLDMLRTPLMLSFNRNNAFEPIGGKDKDYMRRLLESRKPQAFAERLYAQ